MKLIEHRNTIGKDEERLKVKKTILKFGDLKLNTNNANSITKLSEADYGALAKKVKEDVLEGSTRKFEALEAWNRTALGAVVVNTMWRCKK